MDKEFPGEESADELSALSDGAAHAAEKSSSADQKRRRGDIKFLFHNFFPVSFIRKTARYPLMPPIVVLFMIVFWKMLKMTRTGIMEKITAAKTWGRLFLF